MYPDVLPFFETLRQVTVPSIGDSAPSKPIVGVITNSDDRVPSILSSFGLQVGPWRHRDGSRASLQEGDDIDFVMLSYDVGFEKPDSKIFDATKQMLPGQERFVHVGDDLQKDYLGAKRAGWEGVLLDRESNNSWPENAGPTSRITDLAELIAHLR